MKPSIVRSLCGVLTTLGLAACTTAVEEESGSSEGAATAASEKTIEMGRTKSFSGSFEVEDDGAPVKFDFTIRKINWDKNTALWDAKVTKGSGTDDSGLPVEIRYQRCPGCFQLVASENGESVVTVTVTGERLASIKYFGRKATSVELEKTSTSSASGSSSSSSGGGSSSGGSATGSCSVLCGGQRAACKDDVAAGSCKSSAFTLLPRCIYGNEFAFAEGGRCAQ